MTQKLSKIFKEIGEIEPPEELAGLILRRVETENRKRAKRKLFLSYAGLYSSVFVTSYALFSFGGSFLKSDFWSMFSLLFSDLLVVAKNWQAFGYSLMETLPVVNLAAILIPVLAFLTFLNLLISIKNNKHFHKHIDMRVFQS